MAHSISSQHWLPITPLNIFQWERVGHYLCSSFVHIRVTIYGLFGTLNLQNKHCLTLCAMFVTSVYIYTERSTNTWIDINFQFTTNRAEKHIYPIQNSFAPIRSKIISFPVDAAENRNAVSWFLMKKEIDRVVLMKNLRSKFIGNKVSCQQY